MIMNKLTINNYKLNTKGFTLIEMLAVVAIISLLGIILIPNTMGTINTGTNTAYDILVKDITISSQLLFDELEYADTNLYHYDPYSGLTSEKIELETTNNSSYTVTINLQTLVSNGLLTGTNNSNTTSTNINSTIITNPKTKEDIGSCKITITKIVDKNNNYKTKYEVKNNSISNTNCPTDNDYKDVLN